MINRQKPERIRRATNAASRIMGINDALLNGRDILKIHSLLSKKKYLVTVKAEINAMSMQIGIQTQRPDNLTFLWTEVAMRGSSNTIAFFGSHMFTSCNVFFCRSVQMGTNLSFQRGTNQLFSSS